MPNRLINPCRQNKETTRAHIQPGLIKIIAWLCVVGLLTSCATLMQGPTHQAKFYNKTQREFKLKVDDDVYIIRGGQHTVIPLGEKGLLGLAARNGIATKIICLTKDRHNKHNIKQKRLPKSAQLRLETQLSLLFFVGNILYGPIGYLVDILSGEAWHIKSPVILPDVCITHDKKTSQKTTG
ncbi:MAG: hypothetical protein OXC40_01020 [Proteobacteria bacterium]|nr:hypothetical protein [Pseudomonadota bacterium]